MGKDPAVLWYFNDWQGGTTALTRHQKGCYMDLLHAQFNIGHLSLDEIKTVLGSDFGSSWPALQKKFAKDENGLYYNERLFFEKDKRKNYTISRRKNLKKSPHMENVNENENTFFLSLIPNTWDQEKYLQLLSKWIKNRKKKPDNDLVALRVGELVENYPEWKEARKRMEETVHEGWLKFVYSKKEDKAIEHDARYSETFNFDKA